MYEGLVDRVMCLFEVQTGALARRHCGDMGPDRQKVEKYEILKLSASNHVEHAKLPTSPHCSSSCSLTLFALSSTIGQRLPPLLVALQALAKRDVSSLSTLHYTVP